MWVRNCSGPCQETELYNHRIYTQSFKEIGQELQLPPGSPEMTRVWAEAEETISPRPGSGGAPQITLLEEVEVFVGKIYRRLKEMNSASTNPASGSFPRNQFFISGGQSTGVSASASVLPMKYSGLISFMIDLLAVQGTLKSLLQHHSSKASILWHSAFFIVQLPHSYMLLLLLSCFSRVQLCVTP